MFRRFAKDDRGNIAMMFGLLTIPLIAATGAAIDYSHAYEERQVVQDALDSASLAANRLIGLATEDEILAEAQAFFDANTEQQISDSVVLHMVVDGGSVHLWTELAVPTYFLGIVGVDNINFNISSTSVAGAATYEVALVLDNSTSMRGSKIATLKVAARDLIQAMFALNVSNPKPDAVQFAVVPFAASVNVGNGNATAAWMDTTGIGPNAALNFDDGDTGNNTYTNTFDLWDQLANVDWRGCVEARPYPYDVNDATPTTTVPATLFEPMFAPDEPDSGGYRNNYLSDTGGNCTSSGSGSGGWGGSWWGGWGGWWGGGGGSGGTTLTDLQRQERTCKYDGAVVAGGLTGPGEGPNLHCTVWPIQPLTTNQGAAISAIERMEANGYTDIEQGVVWGWRVLSDNAPFTEGRPYGEAGNHKILILMTDGANTYVSQSNMNSSEYMAYNYVAHGVLGTTSTNNNTVVDAMNDRTLEACANLHDTEITIYTIAFEVDDADAQQILEDCASDPSKAFDANNESELIATFRLIAQDIATLRLAE